MNSSVVGELIKDPEIAEWRNSKDLLTKQAVATPFFEYKEIIYRFAFDQNEDLTVESADQVLKIFFKPNAFLKSQVAENVFENWTAFNQATGYLEGIETYNAVQNRPEWMEHALQNCLRLEKLTEPKKAWEFIYPSEIIVTKDRDKKNEGIFIQIYCKCDWEVEHGLQIILKNGNELVRVSAQDGNLFD